MDKQFHLTPYKGCKSKSKKSKNILFITHLLNHVGIQYNPR